MDVHGNQLKQQVLQRRLGDDLLTAGLVTLEQLEEAIEYQCIFGGKLGTSLVELGFVEEEQLAKVLSQQQRLHYIKPELLMNVPTETLRLVPKKIAINYKVVPYYQEGRRLFLAMTDATNLSDIDDLSFQLNHIIVPLAIPEIRLMLALKKHYGLSLSPRVESLAAQLNLRALAKKKKLPEDALPAPATGSKAKSTSVDFGAEETWHLLGEEDYQNEPLGEEAYFDFKTPSKEITYTSLCQQLVAARDRNDIARARINYLAAEYFACGLVMVRPSGLHGWLASCHGAEPRGFDQFNFPLDQNSIFDMVRKSKTHFLGMATKTPANSKFLAYFEVTPPQGVLIFPLQVGSRLVNILFLLDKLPHLEKHFAGTSILAEKAKMAFTLLILKNKLLTI